MKIRYEIADGYVGGHRPQSCNLDDTDLAACETWDEVEDLAVDTAEEDMRQKINADIDNLDEIQSAWQTLRASRSTT